VVFERPTPRSFSRKGSSVPGCGVFEGCVVRLAEKACVPCRGGVPPLGASAAAEFLEQLDNWEVAEGHHLTKTFKFPDFKTALGFVNRIGMMAEEQNHHPDIYFAWGKVRVDVWTHKINGLTESDFVFAAKCDVLFTA